MSSSETPESISIHLTGSDAAAFLQLKAKLGLPSNAEVLRTALVFCPSDPELVRKFYQSCQQANTPLGAATTQAIQGHIGRLEGLKKRPATPLEDENDRKYWQVVAVIEKSLMAGNPKPNFTPWFLGREEYKKLHGGVKNDKVTTRWMVANIPHFMTANDFAEALADMQLTPNDAGDAEAIRDRKAADFIISKSQPSDFTSAMDALQKGHKLVPVRLPREVAERLIQDEHPHLLPEGHAALNPQSPQGRKRLALRKEILETLAASAAQGTQSEQQGEWGFDLGRDDEESPPSGIKP